MGKIEIINEFDCKKALYQNYASEVKRLLECFLNEEGIQYNAITNRVKERESLEKKIDRKQDKYSELKDITDIAGIRIITYYIDDVDKVADIVEREFCVDSLNSIDKRESLGPDRFGYCSVHYVVEMNPERLKFRENKSFEGLKCEIQIRSVLQHAWAEIEHDTGYKSDFAIPKDVKRNFSRLAGLLEIADKEFQEIRNELDEYKNRIEDKMSINELKDVEIDAVSLNTFLESDQDILYINKKMEEIFGSCLDDEIDSFDFESSIKMLHWFGISFVDELKMFVTKNKEYAIEIAKKKIVKEYGKKYVITKTIAIFYLCYAELYSSKSDVNTIIEYLDDNHIDLEERRDTIAHTLYKIFMSINQTNI